MLKIALPNKGRLSEEVRELFNDAGLEVRARGERAAHREPRGRVRRHLRAGPGHPRVRL